MKKRIVAVLLSGMMAVCTLAGCGSGSDSKDDSSDSSKGGTTLSILASQDWIYDAEMELGKQFEEENGIKVDYQIVPSDQYYNLLMTK